MPLRADRFKELRLNRGLTIEETAERLEIGARQISRYEAGESDPSADVIARSARLFEVTADYLLGLVDDPAAHLTQQDLSPLERKLIMAVRQGLKIEALETFTSIMKGDKQSGVASSQETING